MNKTLVLKDTLSAKQQWQHAHRIPDDSSQSLLSACFLAWVQTSGIVARNREHIFLFQIYHYMEGGVEMIRLVLTGGIPCIFPGSVLNCNCSVAPASRVLAEPQAPSAPALMLVLNLLRIFSSKKNWGVLKGKVLSSILASCPVPTCSSSLRMYDNTLMVLMALAI